jgi:hypothetical protein
MSIDTVLHIPGILSSQCISIHSRVIKGSTDDRTQQIKSK